MRVYVAGPMRGIPEFNFPAFDSLAYYLRKYLEWEVANPAEHDREVLGREKLEAAPGYAEGDIGSWSEDTGFDFAAAMRWDLNEVLKADAIVLLPGWENSTGAKYERMVAEAAGKGIVLATPDGDGWDGFDGWDLNTDPVQKRLTVFVDHPASPASGKVRVVASATSETTPASSGGPRSTSEVMVVDPKTGGTKGSKDARFDLVPTDALWALAEHYGRGARKYEDRNWEKGYAWNLSYAALQRHLLAWWGGEDTDEETGSLHIIAVAWHAFALLAFQLRNVGTDNRPKDASWQSPSTPTGSTTSPHPHPPCARPKMSLPSSTGFRPTSGTSSTPCSGSPAPPPPATSADGSCPDDSASPAPASTCSSSKPATSSGNGWRPEVLSPLQRHIAYRVDL